MKRLHLLRFIRPVLIVLALLAGAQARAQASGTVMTWNVEGVTRQALVFTPTASAGAKAPVVFFFHGFGGNMNQGAKSPNAIQNLWPEAVVVYPQGLTKPSRRDPQRTGPGWQDAKGEYGDRDLKFVDAMISTLREKYAADDKRVYAAGFSNGAVFSYLLWAERAQSFAAFGIVSGHLE
ncbi:MAG TPA: PHB depolymerase family esterase, partial [bacterium]|nr:PHB depolymerase family esterase [bacterium]